jgi:hypothetical protein
MPNKGKGHAVHLDNLFTSSKLLSTLRDYGTGAASTVRTSKTKREENEEMRQDQEFRSYEPAQDQDLDSQVQPTLDLIQEIREDLHQNLRPQTRSQGRTTKAKKPEKEKNFEINKKLIEIKIK